MRALPRDEKPNVLTCCAPISEVMLYAAAKKPPLLSDVALVFLSVHANVEKAGSKVEAYMLIARLSQLRCSFLRHRADVSESEGRVCLRMAIRETGREGENGAYNM